MLLLLPLVLAFAGDAPVHRGPFYDVLESPTRHVRTTDRTIAGLLKTGAERSYTFAHLLRRLESTDVTVYIEQTPYLPHRLDGSLVILPIPGPRRYVRIQLTMAIGHDHVDAIGVLAHELWHAIEVADSPEVHDDNTLAALYKRIGMQSVGENFYETTAAQETGKQVRRELTA